jgi:iron complex outermembrane receptor protein
VDSNNRVAYRINSSYENAGSFREDVTSERIYFNPSFLIRAGKKTEVLVEGDYMGDKRTLDYGTGAIDYKIIDLDRSTFLGAPWSYNKAQQKSATVNVTHSLTSNIQIKALMSYQSFANELFGTTRPNSGNFVQADGKWRRGLQRNETSQDYYIGQLDATASVKTGSIDHDLLLGADRDVYHNASYSFSYKNPLVSPKINNGNVYDSINVFNTSLYETRSDIPEMTRNTRTDNPIYRSGIYFQDLVHITPQVKVLAGIRYSVIRSESNVYNYATDKTTQNSFQDEAFTPRFGVVYQPIKTMSIFASYANSFNLNTARDTTDNILPPSFVDQYEAGIKNELFRGALALNITAYQIVNSNLAQPYVPVNPKYPSAQQLAGEVTSKGVELDVVSKPIHGFSFVAGYSFNDTRYTRSKQYIVGSRLRYNPSHTANASVCYSFEKQSILNGLTVGILGFYMGERVGGRSTQVNVTNDTRKLMPVDPYFQFDATAGYTFEKISIRVKVSNVFNVLSYNVHDDNSVNPIAPRLFSTTLAYKL